MIRVAVFCVACVVALFVAEWSVRLALPAYDPAGHIVWRIHPVAGTVLGEPNTTARQIKNSGDYDVSIAFNRHGFRDTQDISFGTREDVYILGDSFAFGWGVEAKERFSNKLAPLIGRRVFNVSSSVNLDGYEKLLAYAESLGAEIQTLVLALNLIDDVNVYREAPATATSPPAMTPAEHTLMALKVFLLRESALYFLLTQSVNNVDWLRATMIRLGLIRTLGEAPLGAPSDEAIESTMSRIALLGHRYDLTVMLIPSRALWLGKERGIAANTHRRVTAALTKRGIRVVDPRLGFEAGRKPLQYHFRNDGHWNPAGHGLAAAILSEALKDAQ